MNLQKRYDTIFWVEVHKIKPNPMQPRREFDGERLNDLAESIRQYGVIQPLVVSRKEIDTERGRSVEYELVTGERRLRAAQLAGLYQVPVIIYEAPDDKTKLELTIIENLQREDLNAIERALAFKKLTEEFRLKHHEVAFRIGKSREYVTNTIRLLLLPVEIQDSLTKGELSEGHCRPILALNDKKEEQIKLYREILDKKISVRKAEKLSREVVTAPLTAPLPEISPTDPELKLIEQKLRLLPQEELDAFLNSLFKSRSDLLSGQ
ncbi:MAG: ParB/RepB/Spo0J family partition protein [Candidatus Parcubacteria bacterium]|nr:ParB/RepB/Spo0J family partition protein [Candidatus Parcubacteria bacterium]